MLLLGRCLHLRISALAELATYTAGGIGWNYWPTLNRYQWLLLLQYAVRLWVLK